MRLGLIARADSRGLGIQCLGVYRNLHPVKTMVVDCPSAKPLPLRPEWYPDATWVKGLPTATDFRVWLQDLTHVYTAETAYNRVFWDEAERVGVKTALHVNPEFLDRKDRPTLWLAPSLWRYDEIPDPKCFLAVPIELDKLAGQRRRDECRVSAGDTSITAGQVPSRCTRFLHVVGRPAVHDRNGTADLLKALRYVTAKVTVTIKCQEPGYVNSLVRTDNVRTPNNVTLVIDSGDVENYWDNYTTGDVLVMPRRFGGLCLPVNEALGAGMPVIMPDISPNNGWLPSEWLVPAGWKSSFVAKQRVDVYGVNPKDLAAKIDQFAQDREFFRTAQKQARELSENLSWDALKPLYIKTFEELI